MGDCLSPGPEELLAQQSAAEPFGKRQKPRSKFTPFEDNKLKRLVEELGESNWDKIAQQMDGRNARQCHDRYTTYLAPFIRREPFSQAEDELLVEKYNKFGPHWVKLATFFHNRTDASLKNRYNVLRRNMSSQFAVKQQTMAVSFVPNNMYFQMGIISPEFQPMIQIPYQGQASYIFPQACNQVLVPIQQQLPTLSAKKTRNDEDMAPNLFGCYIDGLLSGNEVLL